MSARRRKQCSNSIWMLLVWANGASADISRGDFRVQFDNRSMDYGADTDKDPTTALV